ncbi:hypothetical protein ASC84_11150 [Acinetobacter sp. Root1280]|uniref:hypothetical protein n=1 Tax=Acinetobacter sp. Root1280 TaxID=1736444 RepID=UPI0006FD75DF|nr:hypothetical protein [Acinetobacter sp. Root1280]KQW88692.1 hypothetical protein ASC84_11150 [Acinetobacter sp. Root1280]
MVKNKWLKSSLGLFVILSSSACNRAQNLENTFTLGTGVEIVAEENKCDGAYEKIKPTILKLNNEKAYLVSLTDFFSCAEREDAYLTLNSFKKSTLVIYGENKNRCECVKSLKVKIDAKRIDTGDVLYIVSDNEVIDHLIVP